MEQLDKWNKELDLLSSKSYKDIDDKLFKFYKKSLKQLKSETKNYIENYDSLSFSKRLEVDNQIKVANRIDEILWDLEAEKQPTMKDYIRGEANHGYYGTWYALEGNENVQVDFGMLNETYIERLVEKKVAGKSLSKRLYEHRTQLANTVTNELLNGAVTGKGYAIVAKNIAEQTEASYKRALRIARTEGGRVQSTTKQRSYKEAEEKGIKLEKKWLATLDKKTRHAHQELDGQTVAVDDKFTFNGYEAEAPRLFGRASLDINCRCTTIAVVNGMSPELRKDNVTKEIVDYKNYNDWYESKDTRTNIKKKDYSDYVNVLGRKYKTTDFSKLLGKMSDDEYKKLSILDVTDNEIEFIPKKQELTLEQVKNRIKDIDDKMWDLEDENYGSMTEDEASDLYDELYEESKRLKVKQKELEPILPYKKLDEEDLFQYQTKSNSWYNQLETKEVEAIQHFTDSGYSTINNYILEPDSPMYKHPKTRENIENNIKDLDSALSKFSLKEDLAAYRGVSTKELRYLKEHNSFKEFKSTSFDFDVAKNFSNENSSKDTNIVKFNLPKGTKGAFIGDNSKISGEAEFLLARNTKYSYEEIDGERIITILLEGDD
ncbi:ADP-ribosyltransferase [Desemzia sp. FAM 23989]|uniref:ADP-ribosyltransferase n=1 Tax=Desemzia sp. FAM 23989 TaxID=3259523 RepID=UPI00388BB3CF